MSDEHARFYAAMESRDPRFDGRFFSGILSTGIYCRPVCPARTPARKNVQFYPSAAAAQDAGFRACLRCRPETAPGAPAWTGSAATVTRAHRLIREGALARGNVSSLAERLGVGPRHLRRLFIEHLGASPKRVAQVHRLSVTRLLLVQTTLPMGDVCRLAGFGSIRRFNDAVSTAFGRTPTALRAGAKGPGSITLKLSYRPPLAWRPLLRFLKGRAPARVERVQGDVWERVFGDLGAHGVVKVRNDPARSMLLAEIPAALAPELDPIIRTLRRVFDLDADPAVIDAALGRSQRLGPRVRANPGLRIPGATEGLELMIRAVLGQQISVAAANTLFARIVERWGPVVETAVPELDRLFPSAEALIDAPFEACGVTSARSKALRSLCRAAVDGELDLSPRASLEAWVSAVCAHPGIGPWTAHYVALRAAGEPDAFPSSDLGLRRAGRPEPVSARELETEAELWRPWRGYAAIHLWNEPTETS